MGKILKTEYKIDGHKFRAGLLIIDKIKTNDNGTYYEAYEHNGTRLNKFGAPVKIYRIKKETDHIDILYVGRKKYPLITIGDLNIGWKLLPLGKGMYALFAIFDDSATILLFDGIEPHALNEILTKKPASQEVHDFLDNLCNEYFSKNSVEQQYIDEALLIQKKAEQAGQVVKVNKYTLLEIIRANNTYATV